VASNAGSGKGSYEYVAPYYDVLQRLVFGNTLLRAQETTLHSILPADHIVIAGGGSGLVLESIARLHPSGLTVTYIDASPRMIAKARRRNYGDNKLQFITAPVQEVALGSDYDIVITPFLFDNFSGALVDDVFLHLHGALRPGGSWLNTDFSADTGMAQRTLLKLMYAFFRLTCRIDATRLPDMDARFKNKDYSLVEDHRFMKGFVTAKTYRKCP